MTVRKNKLKISIKELSFEFEGSREDAQAVQQGIQQTLGSLMTTQSRVLDHRKGFSEIIEAKPLELPSAMGSSSADARPAALQGNGEKMKQPRTRRLRANSPTALMREMKTEGFFVEPRSVAEIKDKLVLKGHNFEASAIAARLTDLVKRKELFRDKGSEEGSYVYKESQFHESARSQSSPDQLVE